MNTLITILVSLIAIEHVFIGIVEMFGDSKVQAKMFEMDADFLAQKNAKIALSNQGIYNIMLGIVIIIFQYFTNVPDFAIQTLLSFIVVVGIYGGLTVTRKIFIVQALPALITILLFLFN